MEEALGLSSDRLLDDDDDDDDGVHIQGRRKLWIAICGGIVLEDALNLSSDRLLGDDDGDDGSFDDAVNYLLTARSRVLLEELTGYQLISEFPPHFVPHLQVHATCSEL